MPRNDERENQLMVFVIGVASGIMIGVMISFVLVVGNGSEAYAVYGKPDISMEVSDHGHVEPVVERAPEEGRDEQPPELQEELQAVYDDAGWEDPDLGYLELKPWVQPDSVGSDGYTERVFEEPDNSSLRVDGVQYSDDGTKYTWYSENVLPGGGLDIPGRHVGDGGYVMDGDGNICVASSDHEVGTVLETPYGTAVVYDTGCPNGTVDVYTSW